MSRTRRFIAVWVALIALLLTTFGSAYFAMGTWNSIVNLAIAVVKALLVALFFMHLKSDRPVLRVPVIAALFTLALLFGLVLADYSARTRYAAPWQVPEGAISRVER